MENVFSFELQDGIAVITMDVPGAKTNTWTEAALNDIARITALLEEQKASLKGAIFISGKAGSFHAGADLNLFTSNVDLTQVAARAARELSKFETLGIPTVAAIKGVCLGGGYELSLLMTARIAADSPTTVIGLPECNVGVLPGGGGTQRLPRLIGYPALGLILRGETVSASRAVELGMIDRLVSTEDDLLEKAKELLEDITRNRAELKRPQHDFSQIDGMAQEARQTLLKATRGRELPSHRLALKAMREGLKVSLDEGLEIERECFLEVMKTPECKGSINTFFIKGYTDKPEAMMTKGFKPRPLRKVAVLGYGTMGRGIVIDILRRAQIPVVVKDLPQVLPAGTEFVRGVLQEMADKGRLKVSVDALIDLIKPVTDWSSEFKDIDLVIEAVFEDVAIKSQVYKELCQVVADDCPIATNTSSLMVSRLAEYVTNPQRFCGAHFFSPVWRMELLEIVRGSQTSQDTIDNLLSFCSAIRKRPIICGDNEGFAVNAMLFHYLEKAFELMEDGVGPDKIDAAMVSFGLPLGPFKLLEEGGFDFAHAVLSKVLNRTPKTLDNMVTAGRYGRKKCGKGVYLADGSVDPEFLPLIAYSGERREFSFGEIQETIYRPFVDVGKELLDKGVVKDPRFIDVGAIWGIGFPVDKGGPMKWADLTGLSMKLYGTDFYN